MSEDAAGAPDPDPRPGEVTRLLKEASYGRREAFDHLLPLIYGELRSLASSKLRMERSGHTLNATALVHEAYLNLVEQDRVEWQSRSHFFAVASQAMRRILINYAKMRKRTKRGGGTASLPMEIAEEVASTQVPMSEAQAIELLALDEALERLRGFNEPGHDVVQYRFFGGLANQEIAEVLGVSEVTVRRHWTAARSWLRRELDPQLSDRAGSLLVGP